MTRSARRTPLAAGYILHHRPYRDTSRILETYTREFGRLTLFARGVRGPKARLASVLQPFQLLLFSWSGRGEAAQLTGAEAAEGDLVMGVPSACLMSAFYLNELLMKLTTRQDPLPPLFDAYHDAVEALKRVSAPGASTLEPVLRVFEKRLLEALGYGLDLGFDAESGDAVEAAGFYVFRPAQGLFPAKPGMPGVLAGSSVVGLAEEQLDTPRKLEDARRLLKIALTDCLEGRELSTRAVARAVVRRESRS